MESYDNSNLGGTFAQKVAAKTASQGGKSPERLAKKKLFPMQRES